MSDSTEGSSWFSKFSKLFSDEPETREDILTLLKEAQAHALIDKDAFEMIKGVLEVSEAKVRDIMVPRSQMDIISVTDSLEEVLDKMLDTSHSRYPVLDEEGKLIGVLLAKDLLRAVLKTHLTDRSQLAEIYRDAYIIPESKRLNVLLKEFKSSRNHIAVVVDEYGETSGLVTIEDVLEQIVGEIEDEHDVDEDNIVKHLSGGFNVAAITFLDDFNAFFKTDFQDEQLETIGGLINKHFGYIPKEDEQVLIGNYNFRVLKANGRRVESFLVTPLSNEIEDNTDTTDKSMSTTKDA